MNSRAPAGAASHPSDGLRSPWSTFLDGLVSQSGRNIAVISALVGGVWMLAAEFRDLNVAVARMDERVASMSARMAEQDRKMSDRLHSIDGQVARLAAATEALKLGFVAVEARLGAVEKAGDADGR